MPSFCFVLSCQDEGGSAPLQLVPPCPGLPALLRCGTVDLMGAFLHAGDMLLYLHVPFCRSKCRYCAFFSEPLPYDGGAAEETLSLWAATLLEDLRRWGEHLGHPAVETVYFGGGTPSLVSPALLGKLLDAAATAFALEDGAEISMEANPESMTPERAPDFRLAGVNRISLGVQALDDAQLCAVGRVHDRAVALHAYAGLRRAGFQNVGLDFIWGLPGESLESWRQQLEEAAALRPEHLSCYGLTPEEGTPLFRERSALPGEDVQAAMYLSCGEILDGAGYEQYEVSNHALPGHACRHNLGYWRGADYLGLGPAAVSTVGGRRWTQPASLRDWREAVHEARFNAGTEALSFTEQAEELVMLSLRTSEGLDEGRYRALTGRDFARDNAAFLRELAAAGLAERKSGRVRLTRRGMLLSNSIIERFFEALPEAPCLH